MGGIFTKFPLGPVRPPPVTESADFAVINNKYTRLAATKYRSSQSRRALIRWACFFVIGVAAAGLFWIIRTLIEKIQSSKFGYFRDKLQDGQYANAWGLYLGFMLVLVWGALFLVFWAPMAAGGGVPEVISFLNGSRPKGLFDLKTGLAKAAALILAVSSGLAIG